MAGQVDEDIDRFLYGDEADAIKQSHSETKRGVAVPSTKSAEAKMEGEMEVVDTEETTQLMDYDEDVEIILGGDSNRSGTVTGGDEGIGKTGFGIDILEGEAGATTTSSSRPVIDLNAVGQLSGISILETDLDSFEDRPWRKPGADITDYFNYGFSELTWRQYCQKQKMMRSEISTAVAAPATNLRPPMIPPGMPFPPMMPPPFLFRPPIPPPPGSGANLPPQRRPEEDYHQRRRSGHESSPRDDQSPSRSPSVGRSRSGFSGDGGRSPTYDDRSPEADRHRRTMRRRDRSSSPSNYTPERDRNDYERDRQSHTSTNSGRYRR